MRRVLRWRTRGAALAVDRQPTEAEEEDGYHEEDGGEGVHGDAPFRFRLLPHRAVAALRAISARLALDSAFALATPPLDAPRAPRARAAALAGLSSGGGVFGACPVASITTRRAFCTVSGLLARAGMAA